jgi:hypothetical protein
VTGDRGAPVTAVPPIAELFGRSGERDLQLRLRLAAWREGWRACQDAMGDVYEAGFTAGIAAYKAAQHDAVRLVELDARRWELRGEPRTRSGFARPHPDDYPGQRGKGAA